jgi:hypothetical protein
VFEEEFVPRDTASADMINLEQMWTVPMMNQQDLSESIHHPIVQPGDTSHVAANS